VAVVCVPYSLDSGSLCGARGERWELKGRDRPRCLVHPDPVGRESERERERGGGGVEGEGETEKHGRSLGKRLEE